MNIAIKRKTRNLEKLINKITNLKKSQVESGYFSEQGDHPTAEMSFVDLATYHATVSNPVRDIRLQTKNSMLHTSGVFRKGIERDLKRYFYKTQSLGKTLDSFGKSVTRTAIPLFGDTSVFASNSDYWADLKGKDSPLVDEGHLRDAWAWRTSVSNTIHEYKDITL